jgi:hypothetical protein
LRGGLREELQYNSSAARTLYYVLHGLGFFLEIEVANNARSTQFSILLNHFF